MTTDPAETAASPRPRTELPPEPQHAHPVRFRRLKRYATMAVLFLAVVVGARLWWGHEAARRLAAEVAAIRARGEPVLPEDFAPAEVPDAADAIRAYQRAAGTISLTATQQAFRDQFDEVLPFTDADRRRVKGVLDRNARALQQARAARGLTGYRALPLASPVYRTIYSRPGRSADLALLLKWLALFDHETGDDAGAVEALRDMPPLAVAADREIPSLYQHDAVGQISTIGAQTVFQVAHDLAVEGDTAPPVRPGSIGAAGGAAAKAATRAQVAGLIAELLNDAPLREGMVRAIWGHRMMVIDGEPAVLVDLSPPVRWLVRPAVDLNTVRAARRDGQDAAAAAEPDYSSARAKLPPAAASGRRSKLDELSRLSGRLFANWSDMFMRAHYRYLAERRMAAVALAVRLYRANHAGRWPESLDELVPAYLPSVPIDPFAAGGRPLRYLRDTQGWDIPPALAAAESSYVPPPGTGPFLAGPAVYSVGEDGIDDGGSRQLRPKLVRQRRTFSFERAEWRDLVVPLAGNPEARNPNRTEE